MNRLTPEQLAQWHADRARQALIGTNFATHRWCRAGSRGDYMQAINNGIALRTYRSIAGIVLILLLASDYSN